MSVSSYPMSSNKKDAKISLKYIPCCSINCNIGKSQIYDIIGTIFNYCCVTVYGYDKSNDKYWGKKIKNQNCELYFEFLVKNNGENNSIILITPNIGTYKNFSFIYKMVNDVVSLHATNNLLN
jgi:hypothetical protein